MKGFFAKFRGSAMPWVLVFIGAIVLGAGIALFVVKTRVQQPEVYDWKSSEDVGTGNVEIDTGESYPETQNGDAAGSSAEGQE